ncbi:hypothetical protein HN011_001444 [Eciton burchellii]|nr:hypothetical protein HN011_001444 [Eciton burchellii]
MNIVCVICSDLLVPSSDVFHTPCGHIFHFQCLTRWLERSRTCPQCRERTTEHKIHRIYFNFSNNDSIVEDATALQHKVDNMTFQVKLKDKDINNLTEIKSKLENMVTGLRTEVKRVESEMNGKNCVIHALKEQIKFYKVQCQDMDNQKRELERLRKNVESLKTLQTLIDASVDEVDEMIAMTRDPTTLITYISVMKREMTVSFKKRRELRDKVSRLQQESQQLSAKCASLTEEHVKRKELEKQLIICESEKIKLQNQLHDEQKKVDKCVCNNQVLKDKVDSSRLCEEYNFEEESNTKTKLDDAWKVKDDSCVIIEPTSVENTPQNLKPQGFFSIRSQGIKRSNSNIKIPAILAKKPKFNQLSKLNERTANRSMTFDGFGGHTKYDKFPDPISASHVKRVRDETKTKKPKLDTGDNQKLSDMLLI